MDSKSIFETLQTKFGTTVVFGHQEAATAKLDAHFFVSPEHLLEVSTFLRDDPALAFNYLECVTGVDYPDRQVESPAPTDDSPKGTVHVVYHLFSYTKRHRAVVKVSLARETPSVASVAGIWSAANWQERECFDLLGVHFEGHPDLRRIMMPDDWVGYPLRKDFTEQTEYHGIPTTRPNPIELLSIRKVDKPAAPPASKEAVGDKPVESTPS